MRCRIEQRNVVKSKPETKCHRVPREFCHKEECKEDDSSAGDNLSIDNSSDDDRKSSAVNATDGSELRPDCYFRQQIVSQFFDILTFF
jgi:hypothetical protein